MVNNVLNETTIGTAKVVVDILPVGKVIPSAKINPTSITIHQTGNPGAPAKNNHNYMKTCNKNGERIASWHFTVDDKEIWQAAPGNGKCYHAGNGTGNSTSIGIEICMFHDAARQKQAYLNAIELVKILMKYYNLGVGNVKQHYHWTKKDCPAWLRSGKYGLNWKWFTESLGGGTRVVPSAVPPSQFKPFLGRVTVNGLNCRKGPGMSYDIEGQIDKGTAITIIEQRMNGTTKWYKAKSGYWVAAQYLEFVKNV